MNTNNFTAIWAGPSFFFAFNKMPNPIFLYCIKIVDHAHSIFSSIPLVQMIQPVTGIAFTLKTIFIIIFS